ncbi:MAG TPA: hypothetical protein VJP06_00170, partial [Thermoplasmata archaeon]|nr:hypothetical protein [Thermoplasmata archaeon]
AYGILISPIQLEYSRSSVAALDRSDAIIRQTIAEFTKRAEEDLRSQEFNPAQAVLEPSVDLRFRGQSYDINVPVRGNLAAAFRSQHRKRYGYAASSESIELVTVRLAAHVPRPVRRPVATLAVRAPRRSRRVLFGEGWFDTPVVPRDSLVIGAELEGPAIVEEEHATTVVPPTARLRVQPPGILEIRVTT